MTHAYFLIGLIWATFLGLVAGNYATNPIYRLPRGESLFGRKPYCGDCNAALKPKDLFPVFSWMATKGRCRYCGARVPAEYTLCELWVTFIFVASYLTEGFNESSIVLAFGLTGFVMLAMMERIDGFFSWAVLGWVAAFGLLRSVQTHMSLYPALTGGFYFLLFALAYWKISPQRTKLLPSYVPLVAVVGLWLKDRPEIYGIFFIIVAFLEVIAFLRLRTSRSAKHFPFSMFAAAALTLMLVLASFPLRH